MHMVESDADIQYVINSAGERTYVVVPYSVWESLLAVLEEMAESLEDREDVAMLQEWLRARAAGTAEMIPLEKLEEELRSDSLLPG